MKRWKCDLWVSMAILMALLVCPSCQMGKMGSEDGLSVNTKLKIGDKLYGEKFYYDAADYYQKILDVEPNNVDVTFKLAEAQFYSRDYLKAEVNYKKVVENSNKRVDFYFPTARYQYALTLKKNRKYDEAKSEFKTFINFSLLYKSFG